jgi:hypothetical protein
VQTRTTLAMLTGVLLAATQVPEPARANIVFATQGTGSVAIVPDATLSNILDESFQMSLSMSAGPELDQATLTDKIDPGASSIETTLFDTNFLLTGPGGNKIFGTYYLTSDAFSTDGLNETFAGVFDVSGGEGAYAYVYGTGAFSGTNVWTDTSQASGSTLMSISGTLDVPEPPALSLMGLALATLALCRRRQREATAGRAAG